MADRMYRVREFAQLAGVTVRALHHYDRLGLLTPRRSRTGYRLYCAKDLEILEQIVALKFIGLPLDQIKPLLRRNRTALTTALGAQRGLLEQKKHLIERAIAAIGDAEKTLRNGDTDDRVFRQIIEVIEMQTRNDDWKQKYDALVQGKIDALTSMSSETRAQLQQQWAELFRDVSEALAEDPSSAKAQGLADRWVALLGAFAPKGAALDSQLARNFGAAYPAAGEWPAGARKPEGMFADQRIWDFIRRALAARS
jgi:DNA-binding transcriptional MerR regulator